MKKTTIIIKSKDKGELTIFIATLIDVAKDMGIIVITDG